MIVIEGKTVLITGSSRGIGLAIASQFAARRHRVVLNCDKDTEAMADAVSELRKTNPEIIGAQADVSDYEQAAGLIDTVRREFGAVDILVNNAGISYTGLFQQMKPADWRRVMDVNFYSALNCTHLVLPDMIREKKGAIINISSIWGNAGASCEAVYSASKGAMNSFTRAMAREVGPCGIRVNAIACGVIDTEMNGGLSGEEQRELCDRIPLGRFGQTSDVGGLAFFLASDDAAYINGQIITIDGGMIQ